ncbi:hypothetical protein [Streptomyces yaizuensis]|uniref:Uncharacterized protein n=1 Tax=Streptomyces yaizuensis TaxID=2989713 RepID=A0ABQ5NU68_9ACTN|nr:hypothetical protein [Streptomyces sp. YSPA8]GLF93802.1 hypothetical protein SYYSPA8_05915 [Streptomyces sp. YSPA8]
MIVKTRRTPTARTARTAWQRIRAGHTPHRPVLVTAVLTSAAIAVGGVVAVGGPERDPARTQVAAAPLPLKGPWRSTAVPVAKGDLTAVAGLDGRNVWAVGYRLVGDSGGEPLALRWNGSSWQEESKLPAGSWPQTLAVRAADDIWAAGTDTAHWDGTAWTSRPLAADPAGRVVPDALALSPDGSVWVAGRAAAGAVKNGVPAIQRWDGTAWQRQPLPDVGRGELSAVTVVAADDIWAVGAAYAPGGGRQSALALHWNGESWRRVPLPAAAAEHRWFGAVTAVRPGEVWAVGGAVTAGAGGGSERPYTARWDGRKWTEPTAPKAADGRLRSVTRTSDGTLWAAGGKGTASLLLRWDGGDRRWERAADPGVVVRSVTAVPGSRSLWTVGIAASGDMIPAAARLPR